MRVRNIYAARDISKTMTRPGSSAKKGLLERNQQASLCFLTKDRLLS